MCLNAICTDGGGSITSPSSSSKLASSPASSPISVGLATKSSICCSFGVISTRGTLALFFFLKSLPRPVFPSNRPVRAK